jgi:hypothetical protein
LLSLSADLERSKSNYYGKTPEKIKLTMAMAINTHIFASPKNHNSIHRRNFAKWHNRSAVFCLTPCTITWLTTQLSEPSGSGYIWSYSTRGVKMQIKSGKIFEIYLCAYFNLFYEQFAIVRRRCNQANGFTAETSAYLIPFPALPLR